VDFAQALEEGDTVVVDYRRGRESRRATIVAKRLGSEGFSFALPTADVHIETAEPHIVAGELLGRLTVSSSWLNLELVRLNPDLGDYFGTTDGLLVVRAPEDSDLQIKSGDVILSVDGRPATSQPQLMRILRSYEPGEGVTLEIMRQKRRMTLTVKIPERRTPRPERFEHQWDFGWNSR
jgi:S1-C subfamily serine protease